MKTRCPHCQNRMKAHCQNPGCFWRRCIWEECNAVFSGETGRSYKPRGHSPMPADPTLKGR